MGRLPATIALCLLLVVAGCAGTFGGETPSNAEEVNPPGVDDDRLNDSETLLDTHADSITETGYGYELNLTTTQRANGEVIETRREQRIRVGAGGEEYLFETINSGGGSSRFIVWGNESVQFVRADAGGETQISQTEPTDTRQLTGVGLFRPHLTAPYQVVDRSTREETTLLTLEATDRPESDAAFPEDASSISSYEARLVVDTDGRIHAFAANAEYEIDGEGGDYSLVYQLTDNSNPEIDRPEWIRQ